MTSHYRAGATFERTVKQHLETEGYSVIRSAGSKGKVDLLAAKVGQSLVIQCKVNGKCGPDERKAVIDFASMIDGIPIIAWKESGKARPLFDQLTGPGPKDRHTFTTDDITNNTRDSKR